MSIDFFKFNKFILPELFRHFFGRHTVFASENAKEIVIIRKSRRIGYFGDRHICGAKQLFSVLQPFVPDKRRKTAAHEVSRLFVKPCAADSEFFTEPRDIYLLGDVILNKMLDRIDKLPSRRRYDLTKLYVDSECLEYLCCRPYLSDRKSVV